METILLNEASELLGIHPQTLLKLARAGDVPAAKPGKRWVFIKEDLIDYLRSKYQNTQITATHKRDKKKCYIKEKTVSTGGLKSQHQLESEYENLLGL